MDFSLAIAFIIGGGGLTALSIYFLLNLRKQEKEQNLKKNKDSQ